MFKKNSVQRTKLILILVLCALTAMGQNPTASPDVSVAGLYPMANSGRMVYQFNEGWRFKLGDVADGASTTLDDTSWEVVCAPHSVQLEPADASGGRNYQGVCWYRKHFTVPADMTGKVITVYFEAVMGKQEVYVNGRKVKDNYCGYLPIIIDLSREGVKAGDDCLIAVKADNSDDKNYPPGKKQSQLDFAYHGGLYRDVWLIGRSPLHITDPNEAGEVAGGGVFVHYGEVTEQKAEVQVEVACDWKLENSDKTATTVRNGKTRHYNVVGRLVDREGRVVATSTSKTADRPTTSSLRFQVKHPHLWSPEVPYLYRLEIEVRQGKQVTDGGALRIGLRHAEFRGKDGFWLNGKPYQSPPGLRLRGQCPAQQSAVARCQTAEGRGHDHHPCRALPAGSGIYGCLRRAGPVGHRAHAGLAILEQRPTVGRDGTPEHT